MSKGSFGERLKRERELRGVSRDEICAATRIGTRFLEALESEQWDILPGGVFNRGFIRAMARFLGLDEDDLIAEYDLAIGEQNSVTPAPVILPLPPQPRRRRLGRFALLGTLSVLVLLGAGWLGWKWRHNTLHEAVKERNRIAATVAATAQAQAKPLGTSAGGSASVAAQALGTSSTPPGNATQGLELKIEAGKETTVSVSTDGSKVFEGSMIAGQSRTFAAQDAIDISAKDGGALLLELNGQTLAPLGPPGQPGNATLTRGDLKPAGGGAD
jgi:cytoskeleton protein RodZ